LDSARKFDARSVGEWRVCDRRLNYTAHQHYEEYDGNSDG
jgi:hypothetical protein